MKHLKNYKNFELKFNKTNENLEPEKSNDLVRLETSEEGYEILVINGDEGFAQFCHENGLHTAFDPYLQDCEENYPPQKAYDIALDQFIDDYLLNNTDFKFVNISKEFMTDFLYTYFS